VVLKGLKRFRIDSIADAKTPYKQAVVNFDAFESDADAHSPSNIPGSLSGAGLGDRNALTVAMKSFAKSLGVNVDWDSLAEIPLSKLIDQAAMISPFNPDDKQSLLEAKTSDERRRLLIGLMHLYASAGKDQGDPKIQ